MLSLLLNEGSRAFRWYVDAEHTGVSWQCLIAMETWTRKINPEKNGEENEDRGE
jgi:hypothetical protein